MPRSVSPTWARSTSDTGWHTCEEHIRLDKPRLEGLRGVFAVAFASGHELGENEIMDLQAPDNRASLRSRSRGDLSLDQTLLPAARRLRSLGAHAMGVVAECGMKGGPVSKRAVDQIGRLRSPPWVYVRLQGMQHRLRWLVEATEDRLTSHDYELVLSGHLGRRSDDVLELLQAH
jgi:hypothetical protein